MKRLQAFKFELQSNGEQARCMRCFAGSCRFVFNKALAMQKAIHEGGEKKLGYAGLCKTLTEWRNSTDPSGQTQSEPDDFRVALQTGIGHGKAMGAWASVGGANSMRKIRHRLCLRLRSIAGSTN